MDLTCPKCKTILPYGGYPKNPNVSTVMCMTCGYTAPGYAFLRICSVCGKQFDVEEVTAEEGKDGELVVTCKKCKEAQSEREHIKYKRISACAVCGGDVIYDPEKGTLRCYCQTVRTVIRAVELDKLFKPL